MKRLKRMLAVLAVLAVALVVAVYAILENLNLEYLRGLAETAVRDATGRELVIAGPIDLEVSLSPVIALQDVSFANAPWASRPQMVTMESFELEVALLPLLSGDIEVRRLILVAPDILLETNAKGEGNWVLEPVAAEAAGGSAGKRGLVPTVNLFALEDAKLAFHSGATDSAYRLFLERLHGAAEGQSRSLSITGTGNLEEAAFELSGELGALKTLAGGAPYPVDLEIKLGGASLHLAGSIDDDHANLGLELAVSAAVPNLAELAPLVGTDLPPQGPFEAAVKVTTIEGGYGLNQLALKLGASDLTGDAELFLGRGRPRISGTFLSKLLRSVDILGAGETGGSAATDGEASPYVIPSEPLPLEALDLLDADLALQVERLQLSDNLALVNLDLGLALKDGRLRVDPLTLRLADGSLAGRAELERERDRNTAKVAGVLDGKDLDFGRLLRETGIDETLSGRLDLSFDLRGTGDTPHAIASTLDGRAEVFSEGGEIENRGLKIFAVGLSDILGPLFGGKSDAQVNCMVARFDLERGVARAQALLFDSEVMTLAGDGQIDLADERLDLRFDTATRQTSLASLAVPFTVGGTMKNPTVSADPVAAATGAVKSLASVPVKTAKSLAGTLERLVGMNSSGGDDRDACQKALAGDAKAASTADTGGQAESATETTEPAGGTGAKQAPTGGESIDEALGNLKRDFKKLLGD